MTAAAAIATIADRTSQAAPAPDDLERFVARYIAMWNEADAGERRRCIEALWTPDGANFTRGMEVRGHAALERRVRGSYEKWVRDGGCFFQLRGADCHHGMARVNWAMVSISGGGVISEGMELLILTADGRIREDYQFILPNAA